MRRKNSLKVFKESKMTGPKQESLFIILSQNSVFFNKKNPSFYIYSKIKCKKYNKLIIHNIMSAYIKICLNVVQCNRDTYVVTFSSEHWNFSGCFEPPVYKPVSRPIRELLESKSSSMIGLEAGLYTGGPKRPEKFQCEWMIQTVNKSKTYLSSCCPGEV